MAPARRLRALVAHDQDVIRAGITACLRATHRVSVVGAVCDPDQTVRQAETLRPDVALVSADMSGGKFSLLRALQRSVPEVRVVAVVRVVTPGLVAEALRAGAVGVVDEGADAEALLEAVLGAESSRHTVGGSMATALLGRLEGRHPARSGSRLTPRQRQILALMARGLSSPKIAAELGIRPATVRLHVRQILRRLGAATRTQAVSLAYRLGLVHLD